MNYLKRCVCYVKAFRDYLKYGVWVPHVYSDTCEKAIIIATRNSFRVADNYNHVPGESVYRNAGLIRSRCIYCGAEQLSWVREFDRFVE